MRPIVALYLVLVLAIAACAGQQSTSLPAHGGMLSAKLHVGTSPIQHIILIVQENRTPDYMFQSPQLIAEGADISKKALNSKDQVVTLHPVSLKAAYDLPHGHPNFLVDYDGGKMDGFDNGSPNYPNKPFGYAPASEVQPYWDMATQYVFADRMFQTNQSGSFPAHQFIVSGSAAALPITKYNDLDSPFNENDGEHDEAGCDAGPESMVHTINPHDGTLGPTSPPCFERPVLSDLLDQKGITWHYYQQNLGTGWWHAMDAIKHVRYGPDYANVIAPPQTILSDITTGNLPGFSWVIPDEMHSDHAASKSASGPSWVAAIVNTLGKSSYWNSTAILITWDDWGGWYDHVLPPRLSKYYQLCFRVPLVIISPYAKKASVSHIQHEFGSLLAFAEVTFGIPKGSLGTTDERADDLMDAFNFRASPRPFVHISAPPYSPPAASVSGGNDP
ncbi:MAG: alkaline phosphatase family protein [Candidatus Tumulicola sp.]